MDSTDGTVNDGISLESSVGVTENAGDASATLEPGQKIQQPEQVTETERTGNDPAPISSQRNGDATDGKSTINGDDLTVADNIQEKEQVLKNVEDGDNQIPKNVEQITKIVPGVTDQVSDVKEDKDQLLKTVQEDKDQVPLTVQKDEGQVPENVQVDKDQVPKIAQEDEGSEGEIVDSDVDESKDVKPGVDYSGLDDVVRPEFDQLDYDEDVDEGEIKSEEGVQPEKAKPESKEMSDGEIASSDGEVKSDSEEKKSAAGKINYDDYEEGEMIDASGPAVPRETCRFFERGSCTWGDRCRFIHPGVNDKGSYRMFDDNKPRPPIVGPPHLRFPPPVDPRGHPMPPNFPPPMMLGPPPPETAWERGLRHAKEMRRRSMQRKVEEPDFMRKREVLSLNEALNVDRDMDYIAYKPLADEEMSLDPFNALEEDERYAVPSLDEVRKYKRFDKPHHKDGRRSPHHDMRRPGSPREHIRREMPDRSRDRRSPPRHAGPPQYDRHQPLPMPHRDDKMGHPSHMRHDYRDRRDASGDRGRHERDYKDRRMGDNPKREIESRVVPVGPQGTKKKGRGDVWNDPWARGRQNTRRRASRSESESSGSSSSSSRSSYSSRSGSSFSSRSSSRSSFSSSYSSSGSSRSPSPKKQQQKTKKVLTKPALSKAKDSPKTGKPPVSSSVKQANSKKSADVAKAKLTKNPAAKPSKVAAPLTKPTAKPIQQERGRPPVKTVPKKGKQKKYDSSSSSEFSHSSSSESRSRSRGKNLESDSDSESSSGSSSGSDSYSSSSSSSSGSSDEEATKKTKPVKKKIASSKVASAAFNKKAVGKVPVPSKPGNKNVKMTINDKATAAKPSSGIPESRKRPAAAMSNAPVKKVSAIANRRVELLEQLKVVENAILKKRAKLT